MQHTHTHTQRAKQNNKKLHRYLRSEKINRNVKYAGIVSIQFQRPGSVVRKPKQNEFPFLLTISSLFILHQFVLYFSFKKLNAGLIVASPKWDAVLVTINKQINATSNEASWLATGKLCRYYYTCDNMIFRKWVISLNNMTVM